MVPSSPSVNNIRDLTQNTTATATATATATRTSPNKRFMSGTIAVHVRYKSLCISLPSSGKQQREMTKFCVVWRMRTTTANISYLYLELNVFVAYSAGASFTDSNKHLIVPNKCKFQWDGTHLHHANTKSILSAR